MEMYSANLWTLVEWNVLLLALKPRHEWGNALTTDNGHTRALQSNKGKYLKVLDFEKQEVPLGYHDLNKSACEGDKAEIKLCLKWFYESEIDNLTEASKSLIQLLIL